MNRLRPHKKIPHLFSKIIVWWCVICATVFSAAALFTLWHKGADATGVLGVIMAFFGGELLFMALRKIMKEKRSDKNEN